jgi:hypothetical protein
METTYYSETLIDFERTTRRYISEYRILYRGVESVAIEIQKVSGLHLSTDDPGGREPIEANAWHPKLDHAPSLHVLSIHNFLSSHSTRRRPC